MKFEFYEDMILGYSVYISQCFSDTSKYDVSEIGLKLPNKEYTISEEAKEFFSETILFLIKNGFRISFRMDWVRFGGSLEIIVTDHELKESHIFSDFDIAIHSETPITSNNIFKNFFVDTILLGMEINNFFKSEISQMIQSSYLKFPLN